MICLTKELAKSSTSILSEIENLFARSTALRIKTENAIKEGESLVEASSKSLQKTVDSIGEDLFNKYRRK
jgi:hypothetical protein